MTAPHNELIARRRKPHLVSAPCLKSALVGGQIGKTSNVGQAPTQCYHDDQNNDGRTKISGVSAPSRCDERVHIGELGNSGLLDHGVLRWLRQTLPLDQFRTSVSGRTSRHQKQEERR
jgi:hypothetical protein